MVLEITIALSPHCLIADSTCCRQGSHFLNTWLMSIPSQLSQDYLTLEEESKIMLRALGALRLLRNRRRIVPDEAGYRW